MAEHLTEGVSAVTGVRNRRRSTQALLALIVLLLVGMPMAVLLVASLTAGPIGAPGPLTLESLRRMLARPDLIATVRSTIVFATGSALLSVALGATLAWITERTDVSGRAAIRLIALTPLVVPGFATTAAWSLLLNERVGILNAAIAAVGIADPPFTPSTLLAMVWVDGSDGFVLPYLLLVAAMRAQDMELEEASAAAGASRARTALLITAPLLAPALLAGTLISFVRAVDGFQVAAMLGIPAGIRLLSTEIYLATRSFPTDLNLASALAVLQVLVVIVAMLAYWRVVGRERLFRSLPRSSRPRHLATLGRWRAYVTLLGWTILALTILLPLATMALVSFMPFYTPPSTGTWEGLGTSAYASVLGDPRIARAAQMTIGVAVGTSTLATLVGFTIAWSVSRSPGPTTRVIDVLAMLPMAIPGVVIALALIWTYVRVPLPIYGTPLLIVIGLVTAFLPYAVRSAHATIAGIHTDLEEAAKTSGARPTRAILTIIVPLAVPGLVVAVLFVLSRSIHAMSVPVLLSGPGVEVLSVVVLDLFDQGSHPELHALAVLMTLVAAAVVVPPMLLRASVDRRLSRASGSPAAASSVVLR